MSLHNLPTIQAPGIALPTTPLTTLKSGRGKCYMLGENDNCYFLKRTFDVSPAKKAAYPDIIFPNKQCLLYCCDKDCSGTALAWYNEEEDSLYDGIEVNPHHDGCTEGRNKTAVRLFRVFFREQIIENGNANYTTNVLL